MVLMYILYMRGEKTCFTVSSSEQFSLFSGEVQCFAANPVYRLKVLYLVFRIKNLQQRLVLATQWSMKWQNIVVEYSTSIKVDPLDLFKQRLQMRFDASVNLRKDKARAKLPWHY